MKQSLTINEIYYSLQGEGLHTGHKCIFIRTTGCNLRCAWCDSSFSFYEGEPMTIESILQKIQMYSHCNLIEITGGEPLLQKHIYTLFEQLYLKKYKILLETSGSLSIEQVPQYVHIVLDLKAPQSQETNKNRLENFQYLKTTDEIKVVIQDYQDFQWLEEMVSQYHLEQYNITAQPVYGVLDLKTLTRYIKKSVYPIRMGTQLHKSIYPEHQRGV